MKKISVSILLFALCFANVFATDFTLKSGETVHVVIPKGQKPIMESAFEMFKGDVKAVLCCEVEVIKSKKKADIVCAIDNSLPAEGYKYEVIDGKLYITGADSHGLAYGLLEISKLMGVSPWEYWADCTPRHKEIFTLAAGYKDEQSPKVRFRGIFINDEDWGLNPWATKQEPEAWTIKSGRIKGAIGPKVNEKIFQLLLRLRANYYWPAMHECSQPFFTIEGNREMAKKYGIYIGGSHCEPMATSPAAEWAISGEGDYNYVTNRENVLKFWKKRLEEVKDQEIVYTLGMRGVHDGPMQGVKTMEDKVKYLQMVIDDQISLLQHYKKTPPSGVGGLFIPYKEVLDIYKNGLHIPDDVTLMWTDDNYGYIRHFPDSIENARKGGNGLYYHCSYWGRPHDYLWLNSMPLGLMMSQLQTAYNNGIRQIWVLNVGDIKPSELQTELFMEMAWLGKQPRVKYEADGYTRFKTFLELFCEREFGKEHAKNLENILFTYFQLTSDCKPEFMAGTRVEEADKAYWNKVRPMPGDWDKRSLKWRIEDYKEISDKVDSIYNLIPADRKDAFFQLVKYPVQAAAQMSFKYLCPDICEQAHDSIQSLTYIYNKVCAGGKWDGIMDASPRNLAVFQKVTADMLPEYPDHSEWEVIDEMDKLTMSAESLYGFDVPEGTDTITIQVRLLPTHPVEGNKLSFGIWVDDKWFTADYETYDRSEEWKQNVLRGYAARNFTIPVDSHKTHHTIMFKALTKGVQSLSGQRRFYIKRQPSAKL